MNSLNSLVEMGGNYCLFCTCSLVFWYTIMKSLLPIVFRHLDQEFLVNSWNVEVV
jgi:hypothetical protein